MNETPSSGRSILSVVGSHSGSGKTTFIVHLVRFMPIIGCLKISPAHDPPHGTDSPHASNGGFFFESNAHLNQPGTDTALYLAAGAARAERLRHHGDGLTAGLDAALHRYPPSVPVVVESSSAVRLLDPVAVILVIFPPPIREMKPGTEAILSKVTDLMVNGPAETGATEAAERLQREFPALHPKHVWFANLISEPPPDKMLRRLRDLVISSR